MREKHDDCLWKYCWIFKNCAEALKIATGLKPLFDQLDQKSMLETRLSSNTKFSAPCLDGTSAEAIALGKSLDDALKATGFEFELSEDDNPYDEDEDDFYGELITSVDNVLVTIAGSGNSIIGFNISGGVMFSGTVTRYYADLLRHIGCFEVGVTGGNDEDWHGADE